MMNELKQKEAELDYLLGMKATDIWNNDLEVFLAEWEVSWRSLFDIIDSDIFGLVAGDARV